MRDSANAAFFTAESLENISEALVREGIQNSLDAARRGESGEREVRVRIAFVPVPTPDAIEKTKALFGEVSEHFARGLGLPAEQSLFNGQTGFLVFEDFGTKGLTGDVTEWRLEKAECNPFFSFFRAEGRSAKTGESLGRWGIGKQVFSTASTLHAMFGLTVREDEPTRVLMGSAVVQTHSINGEDFQPDAWFGLRESLDQPVMPVEDPALIESFAKAFGLTRAREPGLSIVVPCVDDRVQPDDLLRGVVRNFFWPILQGELVVDLDYSGGSHRIDAESLPVHRTLLPPAEAAVVEFAAWAAFAKQVQKVVLSDEAALQPDWARSGEALLPELKLHEIRAQLALAQRVAVQVPVRVRPKGQLERMSYFTLFIEVCREAGYRTLFLRDGIVITDIRAPLLAGNRSLVVVENAPLAGLLGDAEGVNHTQWQKDSPKFHNHYVYGLQTIRFVTRSVHEILRRLNAGDTRGDPTLLINLFYLPENDGKPERSPRPKPGESGAVSDPPGGALSRPRKFDLRRVDDGFSLVPGDAKPETFPFKVRILAGYDVRRGNPIKRYAKDDFIFTRPPLRLEPKPAGVVVIREDGNLLELEIRRSDFVFGVTGFDKKRDLVVRAVEQHETNV